MRRRRAARRPPPPGAAGDRRRRRRPPPSARPSAQPAVRPTTVEPRRPASPPAGPPPRGPRTPATAPPGSTRARVDRRSPRWRTGHRTGQRRSGPRPAAARCAPDERLRTAARAAQRGHGRPTTTSATPGATAAARATGRARRLPRAGAARTSPWATARRPAVMAGWMDSRGHRANILNCDSGRSASAAGPRPRRHAVLDPDLRAGLSRGRRGRGGGWQRGQLYDERFMNGSRRIGVPQRAARLALAAVRVQRPVEVAALAVDVDVQRVEAGAARPRSPRRARPRTWPSSRAYRRPGQRVGRPGAVQLGPPQRLVGVDVADPGDQRLVEQRPLDLGVLARAARPRTPRRRRAGPSGRGRCARSRPAAPRRPAETARPPNVRWSTKRSCGPPSAKVNRTRRCGLVRRLGRLHQQLAGHAEVADDRVAGVERQPQVFAAAARRR